MSAMGFVVTFGTQGNQVVGMIVKFVSVNMMHMQVNAPTFALFAAILASPFVAVLNLLAQTLPVRRVVPFGNTAFPCGIVGATYRAAQNKGFRQAAPLDAKLFHRLNNGRSIDTKLRGNFIDGSHFVNILGAQPVRIMVKLFGAVMTRCIFLPKLIFTNPLNRRTAAARAQGCGAIWLIDGFAGATLASLGICATFIAVLLEEIANMRGRTAKRGSNLFVGRVVPAWKASPVVVADSLFGLFRK